MKLQMPPEKTEAPFGELENFLPYRPAVISHLMTLETSKRYREKFHLRVQEWRVITTIGHSSGVSATDICNVTLIHRAKVSRILVELESRGLILKDTDPNDKRTLHLKLSREGQSVFEEVLPRLMDWERQFLLCLSPQERIQLDRLLTKMDRELRRKLQSAAGVVRTEIGSP